MTARAARLAVDGTLAVAIAACLGLAVGPALLGYRTLTVLSGSMRPLIGVGSLVVVTPEPVSAVAPGQIVTITAPLSGHPVVTHRVVEVVHRTGGRVAVRTRGDRNAAPDPWTAELPGPTVWRYRATVPYVGRVLHTLTGGTGRVVAGAALPVTLAVWVLTGLWLRQPTRARRPALRSRHRRPRDRSAQRGRPRRTERLAPVLAAVTVPGTGSAAGLARPWASAADVPDPPARAADPSTVVRPSLGTAGRRPSLGALERLRAGRDHAIA